MGEARWTDLLKLEYLARAVLVCLGIWLNAADTLVTVTVMPSVVRNIGGYAYLAWPVAVYLLGAIMGGASAGHFAHTRGLRAALLVSAILYAIGCVLSALAHAMPMFLAGRFLQGIGAGLIVGLCYVAMNTLFPATHYRRVLALLSGIWGIATVLGPLLGGLFSHGSDWQILFWMFAAQGALFAGAILVLVPKRAGDEGDSAVPVRTLVLLSAAVIANLLAGIAGNMAISVAMLALTVILLGFALRVDASAVAHLFPRAVANLRDPAGQGYIGIFALQIGSIGFSVYGPAILQAAFGLSPLEAGYGIGVEAMGWTVMALIVAERPHSADTFWIRMGVTVATLGIITMVMTFPGDALPAVLLSGLLLGAGFGMFWAFLARRILELLPPVESTRGSAAMPTTQMLGNAVGSALCGVIANANGMSHGFDRATALSAALWLFACAIPFALFGWASVWNMSAALRVTSDIP